MVAYHEKYVSQIGEHQASNSFDMAENIAIAILKRFGLTSVEEYLSFISKGEVFERGEEVHLHRFIHSLVRSK
jgi:hypothetical protein